MSVNFVRVGIGTELKEMANACYLELLRYAYSLQMGRSTLRQP